MPAVVAHRCNTPELIKAAVAAGVSWVEIDAAVDRSGQLVASHGLVTGGGANGGELPLSELLGLAAARGLRVTVDLKCPPAMVASVCEAIAAAGLDEDVLLSGNYERPWDQVRSLVPEARLGWSPPEPGRWRRTLGRRSMQREIAAAAPALLQAKGLNVLLVHHSLASERLVCALHGEGRQLHAWTVNRARQAQRLSRMGVDAIVTDRPREFAEAFSPD